MTAETPAPDPSRTAGASAGAAGPGGSAPLVPPTGSRTRDRTAEAVAARRREIERGLAELVTPELVAEHRRQPIGHHSPALAWVLAYLRQAPTAGKLVVHARQPHPAGPAPFGLLRLSGRPGTPHEPLGGARFADEDDALHAAFLQRLADHGLAGSGLADDGSTERGRTPGGPTAGATGG